MLELKVLPQHQWLQKFVGQWTYDIEAKMSPDQPPQKIAGREAGKAIGEVWVVIEGTGVDPGGTPCHWVMSLGFDQRTERFVGSWLGSMMSHFWVYDGHLEPDGNTLTLESVGPDFQDQTKSGRYRDAFEFVTNDHRILRASTLTADGTWHEFMVTHYHRVK